MVADIAIDNIRLSLALYCAFVRPKTIAKEVPRSNMVTEKVKNLRQ